MTATDVNPRTFPIGGPILEVDNISLSFGGVKAITSSSFKVLKHEIKAIIGPNGAGKSSMLNCINGIYKPQEGKISLNGKVLEKISPNIIARLGVSRTFQNLALFKRMSVLDNILVGRRLHMKVELGRALATEADLLLLDEPMAGMNVEEKREMCRFILKVNDEIGTTMVLIEHDMGVVMDISDNVVVLDYGKIIADGPPDEVRANQDVIDAYLGVAHD